MCFSQYSPIKKNLLLTILSMSVAGNLLLTEDKKQIKVCDFGLAREETAGDMTTEAGTYRWMAPEVLVFCSESFASANLLTMPSSTLKSVVQHSSTSKGCKDTLWSQGGCVQLRRYSVGVANKQNSIQGGTKHTNSICCS